MIRRGKSEGWLVMPAQDLPRWGALHGARFIEVNVSTVNGKGAALLATSTKRLLAPPQSPLLVVPRDLILSRDAVRNLSRADAHLRQALEAAETFAQTTRGAILIFLLLQATRSCPSVSRPLGVSNALEDYIKFLPCEILPTFWTDAEKQLIRGTSLEPALAAKLNSLYREFDRFREATGKLEWCQELWWDEVDGLCTFDDWLQLDAMYRSRALEFPGIGDAMVPCVDMANHASGDDTDALYECGQDGNAVLLLREGKELNEGAEVTITYGDDKGACEMIFSYGFIEAGMDDARDMFLDLDIPEDDPLRMAKKHMAASAPGVRIHHRSGQVSWDSNFIWLVCVNEEDGLDFRVVQRVDGGRELQAWWNDEQLDDLSHIRHHLEQHPLWDVFQLRAVAVLQERVLSQLQVVEHAAAGAASDTSSPTLQPRPQLLANELRRLETRLLQVANEHLEREKSRLGMSPIVLSYLDSVNDSGRGDTPDDFA